MKELSIEQKAKAYDEALKKAKDMLSYKEVRREDMEYLFPELVESEDEEIRKFLIQMAQNGHGEDRDWWNKCVAWLEKQGKTFTKKDVDDAYLKGICDAKEELEKQGEQNHTDEVKPKFKIGDTIRPKDKNDTNKPLFIKFVENGRYAGNGISVSITYADEYYELASFGLKEECKDCQMNYDGECKGSCAMKRKEQKPAWSEEDREYMESLLDIINGTPSLTPSEVECHKDWLKSLKDRVQPQPKQEGLWR